VSNSVNLFELIGVVIIS